MSFENVRFFKVDFDHVSVNRSLADHKHERVFCSRQYAADDRIVNYIYFVLMAAKF
jgi:hypothetical protein